MKCYNKLIRDKIPQIIESSGKVPIIHTLSDSEYRTALEEKLKEEYEEVLAAETKTERIEELADMFEVMKALAKSTGGSIEEVAMVAEKKAEERGAFDQKIFLEKVIKKDEQ